MLPVNNSNVNIALMRVTIDRAGLTIVHSHTEPALGIKLESPAHKISDHIAVTNENIHRGLLLTGLRSRNRHMTLLSPSDASLTCVHTS